MIVAILFLSASTLCLPVPPTEDVAALYPWWARRFDIGNILLHELLFVFWLFRYGSRHVLGALAVGSPVLVAAISLIVLALWCGLVSLLAPLPWQDLGRTLRLLMNATLIIAVVRWGKQSGTLPLVAIVTGFLVGTLVNLAMSFRYPLIIGDVLRLSGQNTPGVAMGIAIHLSAWWFYLADRPRVKLLVVGAASVFAFACAISFSRIGWFAGATGLLAWCYVIYLAPHRSASRLRQAMRLRKLTPFFLAIMLVLVPTANTGQAGIDWLASLVAQKASYEGEGERQRLAYLYGTIEIIEDNPFGVGYSGFYNAMTKTAAYQRPDAAVEESPIDANPHSTFLWYASAGGIPGLMLAVFVFAFLLGRLRYGLRVVYGDSGFIPFSLIAAAYLVMGLTVPYLFSNIILIFPAAYVVGFGRALRESTGQLRDEVKS